MKTLPVIISIPHSGLEIPQSYKELFLLSDKEVLYDGDAWTNLLYNFEKRVLHTALMPIARCVIDLNRMEVDLPPNNEDGIVKTKSILSQPLWKRPLSLMETQSLINHYYLPYYQSLIKTVNLQTPSFGLDCHSMLESDPFDQTKPKRPLICISNRGGLHGEFIGEKLTASQAMMLSFKTILEEHFGMGNVQINDPFKGGHIIRKMADETNIPWIQIEVNRRLYMPSKNLHTTVPEKKTLNKIIDLNRKLYLAIESLYYSESFKPPQTDSKVFIED